MTNEPILPQPANSLIPTVAYSSEKLQTQVVMEKEKARVVLFAFTHKHELKTHKASVEVLLGVLEGEALFTMGGETSLLKAGDIIRIPANEPHSLRAISNFKMLLIK